jgi:hypothetical protein
MKISIGKIKQAAVIMGMALTGIGSSGAITPAHALTFNFISTNAIDPSALAGFQAAGARWSNLFNDNVTIDLKIDYRALATGTLGQAGSREQTYTYSQVYTALNADKKSADDNLAVSNLSNSNAFSMLINRTSNNPNGSGSATPYVDSGTTDNNSTIRMNTANAKALGLAFDPLLRLDPLDPNSLYDADIAFSSSYTWDFNPDDGITAGAFDFVGVATHEIGHALGFVSGVDVLDYNGTPPNVYDDSEFTFVNTLDLFRYSALSKASNVIDWTADARDKYFSLDRGATNIALFSNGVNFGGDGRQASHWKDTMNLGIMDPTTAPGELLSINENDKRAFDAIGWDRIPVNNNPTNVPEPENFVGTFIFAAFGAKMVLKRRQKLVESAKK